MLFVVVRPACDEVEGWEARTATLDLDLTFVNFPLGRADMGLRVERMGGETKKARRRRA